MPTAARDRAYAAPAACAGVPSVRVAPSAAAGCASGGAAPARPRVGVAPRQRPVAAAAARRAGVACVREERACRAGTAAERPAASRAAAAWAEVRRAARCSSAAAAPAAWTAGARHAADVTPSLHYRPAAPPAPPAHFRRLRGSTGPSSFAVFALVCCIFAAVPSRGARERLVFPGAGHAVARTLNPLADSSSLSWPTHRSLASRRPGLCRFEHAPTGLARQHPRGSRRIARRRQCASNTRLVSKSRSVNGVIGRPRTALSRHGPIGASA